LPQPPQRLVHDNARQPGGQARFATIAGKVSEGGNVCLLHRIFGVAVVAQNAPCDQVKPAIVPLHNQPESFWIPSERTPHQLGVVQNRQGRLLDLVLGHGAFLSAA